MSERIAMRENTHFIGGMGVGRGFRFRKYTFVEHRAFSMKTQISPAQIYRIEFSPEQPGDVIIDLGDVELNEKLRALLDEALQKWLK
jgi:hypothetical protein